MSTSHTAQYLPIQEIAEHCGVTLDLVKQWLSTQEIRHQEGNQGLELESSDLISYMNQNDIAIPAELMISTPSICQSPKALIVTTDRHSTSVIRDVLVDLGMKVITADTGYNAGITYLQKKPVLVAMEIESGDQDSLDLIANISSTNKDKCKILVLSGGMPTLINKIRAAGATAIIPKPYDKDSLKRTAKILLGN